MIKNSIFYHLLSIMHYLLYTTKCAAITNTY